ncbi:MAG: hypothetical protein B7X99_02055 [Rhizobiales bacterium 17-65-6]|jgi:hypothetical protein|nr:MAG: hypothetical protein B7Y84_00300 [Azorhizobium sp. 32-67-21]OZA01075.1 MAG: hypothetical protein B7X99_02055 [Rhizobiales bacterium 17-65-6]
MLKTVRETPSNSTIHRPANWPANDARGPLAMGRSVFPEDAVARIFRPSRCVMTAGRARCKGWRLVFERRGAPVIEPLMGWTAGSDTLAPVELDFPTLDAAIRYAERQGLAYVVQPAARCQERIPPSHEVRPAGRAPFPDLGHFSPPAQRARARPPRRAIPHHQSQPNR